MTPRDLLDRVLVLDLGEGLRILSGVRLLDRNGKRRLRIDPSSCAEIHLHRQLAAALLMPYPARGETVWGTGEPVMQSDRYGIGNIDLARIELGEGTAVVLPERLEIANSDRQSHVDCAERLRQVRLLWKRRDGLPPSIAALLAQHEQEATRQMPLGSRVEAIVADLQRAAAAHARTLGRSQGDMADAVPFLLSLLEEAAQSPIAPVASATLGVPAAGETPPQIPEPLQPASPAAQAESGKGPAAAAPLARATSEADAPAVVAPVSEDGTRETSEEAAEPVPPGLPEISPPAVPMPRRYQPAARVAARKRSAGGARPRQQPAERPCPIQVRLRIRTGGAVMLSLLPRRRSGMPQEVEVCRAGESPLTLSAFHEAWYEDVIPPDLDSVLRNGAAWYANRPDGRLQWMLSGRNLYVLSPRDELSGYISAPRLILGDEHAVLCIAALREQVLALLEQCCGTTPASIDPADGLPPGWIGFRGVCPIRSLPASSSPDILDALRPAAHVQITMRGGIRLQYSQWLVGFPPAIRLVGAESGVQLAVTIDSHAAACQPDGAFTAPGWDQPGDHLVACGSLTRRYSLVAPPDSWESWPAHCQSGNLAICGAAVGSISASEVRPAVVVPATNPLLLGQYPGQIYLCPARTGMLGFCAGAPPFRPVWAVPATPLKADKSTARILLLGWPAPLEASGQTRASGTAVRQWVQAILDCSRKGLRLAEETPEASAIWRAWREQAKTIWRRTREG
jgi:hypothetical protein